MADPNTMDRFAELMRDADDLRQKVTTSQKIIYEHQTLLKDNREKSISINRQILDMMDRMDVLQKGNYGWEARTLNFLLAYRQRISDTGE